MPNRPRISPLVLALAVVVSAVVTCSWQAAEPAGAAAGQLPPEKLLPRPSPAPSIGVRAARIALRAVGVPYRYGGVSPAVGFDCSGLVRWAYGRLGVDLPHSSYALAVEGRSVSTSNMRVGDVLVFEGLGHVGLYLGRGQMVHAPQSGRTVEVVTLGESGYGGRIVTARRITRA